MFARPKNLPLGSSFRKKPTHHTGAKRRRCGSSLSARSGHSRNSTLSGTQYSNPNSRESSRRESPVNQRPPSAKAAFPLSVKAALKTCSPNLTTYEQAEILDYPQIYFVGRQRQEKQTAFTGKTNFGFDDDSNDYRVFPGDHICYRYEVIAPLGAGAFGRVIKVYDHKRKTHLALKILKNNPLCHRTATEEVKILRTLLENDPTDRYCIIRIRQYFTFRRHVCIAFDLMQTNLLEFMSDTGCHGLSTKLTRRFCIQILQALRLMSKCGVIHGDLKPENVMLRSTQKSTVRVIDFGSACFVDGRVLSYVQSRFYRAPEVVLGLPCTNAIDMWSFGCMLVEMLTGFPLFPAESEEQLIQLFVEYLGFPA